MNPAKSTMTFSNVENNSTDPANGNCDVLLEWTDLHYEPLELDEVACIEHDARFRAVFGLLAAVYAQPERSARGLRLAKNAISLSKAHVSAWQLRHECITALAERSKSPKQMWRSELALVSATIMDSSKNYQAWHYRRTLVDALSAHSEEMMLVDVLLDKDPKNYHAWAHRQWLLACGALRRDEELAFVDVILDADVRNNSAWNHRWLLVHDLCGVPLVEELMAVLKRLPAAPRNEALWGFISAFVRVGKPVASARAAAARVLDADENNVPARRFLVTAAEAVGDVQVVAHHCDVLAGVDVMHAKYWAFRSSAWQLRVAQKA